MADREAVAGRGWPAAFPPLRSLGAMPTNVPAQVSSFVGRKAELAAVRAPGRGVPEALVEAVGGRRLLVVMPGVSRSTPHTAHGP